MRTPVLIGTRDLMDVVRPLHPVASVYIGQPDGIPWTDRLDRLLDQLLADGADEAVVTDVLTAVPDEPATPVAVFADGGHVPALFAVPGLLDPDSARYSTPAHVLPLLAWAQERPPSVLVVACEDGVEVAIRPGGLDTCAPTTEWCGPRAAVGACAAALDQASARLLVVHGDDRVVRTMRDAFAATVTVRRVDQSTADRLAEVGLSTSRLWTSRSLAEFDERSGTPGHTARGTAATVDALARNRVLELLVENPSSAVGTSWFGALPTQVHSGDRVRTWARRSGDVTDVVVRSALLGGVAVRVLRPGLPYAPAGGVGALCRFPLAVVPR